MEGNTDKNPRGSGGFSKRAIVTGASRGIGRATALCLAEQGYDLILIARNHTLLTSLKVALESQFQSNVHIYAGDIGEEAFVQSVFEKEFPEHEHSPKGKLELLINNAGISHAGLLQDMTLTEWNQILQTNLTSVFLTCRAAIPVFLKQGCGSIVSVSSVWGNVGAACECAYSASKGAVNSFTRALAKELAPSGIRVNAVAFGAIDTDMNAKLSKEDRQLVADEIGMGRFGTPEEAAKLLVEIAASHTYLTGSVITMDGGWI